MLLPPPNMHKLEETTVENMLEWQEDPDRDRTALYEDPHVDSTTTHRDSGAKAAVAIILGAERGHVFPVEGNMVIGRDLDAGIRINSRSVSRRHAMISSDDQGRFFILDLASRNGTSVNGARITEQRLELGDRIEIGPDVAMIFTPRDDVGDQLREAQRLESLGTLAGGAAHDFNNLLAVFSSSLDFIVDQLSSSARDNAMVQEAIADSQVALSRGAELTKQLKTFAKNEPMTMVPFEVSAVVAEVERLARRTFNPMIGVELELERGLRVEGSASQLHQVLMNLCVNARDAMPSGGTLTLRLASLSEKELMISVADTGAGIDPVSLARVFEPFFSTKGARGTGLGLAIAYRIVRQMRGTIVAESVVGVGSTFTVRLPRCCRS